ncbi:MAG: ABC transporter permease subunit, partial [Mesorhizobium sp.]
VIGTLAAFGLDRMKSRVSGVLRALLITPMVVPGVVLAVGIYAVYLDTRLVGTMTGFVLAHTMLAVPFVIIAVSASLEVFDKRLETAAASLGATRLMAFRTVTLPLIAPGILSGLLFAFVTSFDEIIVALFITSPYLKT